MIRLDSLPTPIRRPARAAGSILLAVLCTAAFVLMAATSPAEAQKTERFSDRAEIVYASEKVHRKVEITDVRFRPIGRFMQVQFDARNKARGTEEFEYQVIWKDANGFAVNTIKSWQRIILSTNQTQPYQSMGQHPDAYQVQITIREPEHSR